MRLDGRQMNEQVTGNSEDGASQGKRLGLEGGTVFVGLEDGIMLGKRLVAVEARLFATDAWAQVRRIVRLG